MKVKPQEKGEFEGIQIAAGTYEAVLKEVRGYSGKRYQSDGYEPKLVLIWDLGEDEDGNPITIWDFVRLPRDKEGYPVLHPESHLYNRLSALYGEPFDHEDPQYMPEIVFPGEYDSPEGLESLPTFEEAKQEGFRPVVVRSIKVGGQELIGGLALITIVEDKNGRSRVKSASAKPKARRPKLRKAAPSEEEVPL